MPDPTREKQVIEAFCDRMSRLFRAKWKPIDFPDPPDIDAHLDCAGIRAALDHTALNSFEGYRLSDIRLRSVAEPLTRLLKAPGKDISVRILFPAKGLPKVTKEMLRAGWVDELDAIIPQVTVNGRLQAWDLKKPPCKIWVERMVSRFPGLYFGKMLHSNSKAELEADLRRAIESKNRQLTSSKRDGWHTILLLETTDISTINEVTVAQAFSTAASATDHSSLDAVFLFDDALRDGKNHMVWPLKFKGVMPPDWRWIDEFRQAQIVLLRGLRNRGNPYIDESGPIPRAEFRS